MSPPPLIWIDDAQPLPPTAFALGPDSDAPGLLAAGGTVSPARLEEAYRRGIFPWYSTGQPVLWWTPDPRMVLRTADFRFHRNLRKTVRRFLRTPGCEIRFDQAYTDVMLACAQTPREGQHGTWIAPEMVAAYSAWHTAGRTHSIETWIDGRLVGGLYGVNLGRMFFGESMFSRRTDASKIALAALVAFCRAEGIALIDCQQHTGHLERMGGQTIARTDFEAHLERTVGRPGPSRWAYDPAHWEHLGLWQDDAADRATPTSDGADEHDETPPRA
ncbi:MAG: leucyl/phenylalanyl-tRNA--protein transferase [Pseudomonadota bacterium]